MKIVRYDDGAVHYGELRGDQILPLEGALGELHPSGKPAIALSSVKLLAPVAPSKIVAVGPNYHAHLKGTPPPPRPYYWLKPASTLQHPEGFIDIPPDVPMVCHESELAIVIGRTARNVSLEQAPAYILGYSCINDVSAGLMTDMPTFLASQYFIDGKIYDSFAPIGPVIVTDIDPHDLQVQCRINGETRQNHRTSDQIWSPAALVSLISHVVTLFPGDVIASGSPPGPGPMKPGEIVEIEIEGIGILRNHVRARPD